MGIIYRTGNVVDALINGEVDFIMHCCNAQGVMGSGVAKEIRQRIPNAYTEYMFRYNLSKQFDNGKGFLGSVNLADGVFNLIGQEYYGYDKKRYVNYGALASCFRMLPCAIEQSSDKYSDECAIGIPYKMASDRAGGNWNIVLELIEHLVVPYVKEVVVYKLEEK